MSDCSTNAWKHAERPDEPIRGEHVMADGERIPWTLGRLTKDGRVREFGHEEVDGRRYMPVGERDWDSGEVTD